MNEIYLHFNYKNIDLLKVFLQTIKKKTEINEILNLIEKEIQNSSMKPNDYFQSINGKDRIRIESIPRLCYLNDLNHIKALLNNIKVFGKISPILNLNNDFEDERQRLIYEELKNVFPELK
jgi:hypothetical protein